MEEEIDVNGKKYVLKSSILQSQKIATKRNNLPYKIVRTYSAGVFAGYLQKKEGKEVTLLEARRFYYWKGAASLSQLAIEGVKNPTECKFPSPVPKVVLTEAIEILDVTEKARLNIAGVPVWQI